MFPFFVHCSFIVRLFSICPCGSHRLLFVFCSSFVRSLFVLCSFFVRSLFVFSLSACAARTICLCGSHYLPVWLALSARAARTICPCGSHRATTACATRTFNASFFTKLLPHTYQNTSQRFFSRQS